MSVTTRHTTARARPVSGRNARPSARSAPHPRQRVETRQRAKPVRRVEPLRRVRPTTHTPRQPWRVPQSERRRARTSPTRTTSSTPGNFQRRIRLVRMILAAALLILVARLVDVQVIHSGTYQEEARSESAAPITLNALRGGIYARNGSPLAVSIPTDDVVADDFQVKDPMKTALALSPLLSVPAATLAPELHRHSGYVVLAKEVSQGDGQKISADAIPGITLVEDSKRIETNANLASPVLGFTNAAGHGAGGIEYLDNKLLSGTAGKATVIESPSGVTLPQSNIVDRASGRAGQSVELTLDMQLQYETEQAVAQAIESSKAASGTAILMDVKTGQILSMANLVSTHPNAPASPAPPAASASAGGVIPIGPKDAVNEASSNNAVTQVYEPGSVFKLVTFSAALQDGLINPNSVFTVPDQISLDGSIFHDADPHPTERLTATQILAQSSNIGTSEIAQSLGEQRLLSQVGALGFGKPTGLAFPGESNGLVATSAQWEPTDYVSLPIGQVDAVNALQVLDAYNAVANGGTFVQPKLVQATIDQSGAVHSTAASATHRVFSPSVDSELTTMLEQVVSGGTGTSAVVPGYTVAGKTGTAQIPTKGKDAYTAGAYMASFVGFAPAVNPTFSMIVVLDRPTPIFGGTVAAPVFSQIMSYALHRYDIPTTPGAANQGAAAQTPSSQAQDIT
jgi:cell division protein FtsI (penicillin-binding protein 3)